MDIYSENQCGRFVVALNVGSSTLKFSAYRCEDEPVKVISGVVDRFGSPDSTVIWTRNGSQRVDRLSTPDSDHSSCIKFLWAILTEAIGGADFDAVVHRVVHGGPEYSKPHVITSELLQKLRHFSPLAPEHLPAEIDLIETLRKLLPELVQIACFDTAFHHDLPTVARILPIPRRYERLGVRRYGFHGLSYTYLLEELKRRAGPEVANARVILAHLGNGASLAAVRDGRCLDTSMGFTPAAGLVMGSRCGDLDPGLFAYLAHTESMTADRFNELVNKQSGMLGVSEISSDMRELLACEESDSRAADAVALFCYQAKKWIGSFAAVLGGLDTIVFSGGIGENCESIRTRICDGLDFLGVSLNEASNSEHSSLISARGSKVAVYVIKTDEELLMARSANSLLATLRPTAMEANELNPLSLSERVIDHAN